MHKLWFRVWCRRTAPSFHAEWCGLVRQRACCCPIITSPVAFCTSKHWIKLVHQPSRLFRNRSTQAHRKPLYKFTLSGVSHARATGGGPAQAICHTSTAPCSRSPEIFQSDVEEMGTACSRGASCTLPLPGAPGDWSEEEPEGSFSTCDVLKIKHVLISCPLKRHMVVCHDGEWACPH